MNKEFRDFLAAEYNKMTAKEQKAADTLADEEKTARQKGAQKAAVTKQQKKFMDMLKSKVVDTNPQEPSEPEETPTEEPQEPQEPTQAPDENPTDPTDIPNEEPSQEPAAEPSQEPKEGE